MTASEEERKVNVDRAKRAFTDNTLFAPTHHGTVPETAATCEDSMAPEDDHPEIGETEEAEADVEDIVIEVPDQPTASASSSSAAPTKKLTALERCIALNLVYGTGARSGQFKKQASYTRGVFEFFQLFNCLMSEASDNETDSASQTGSWNIPHLPPALLHVVCIRVAVVLYVLSQIRALGL